MIDPAKLAKGAQAVYGEEKYAQMYGEIVPIPAERVVIVDDQQEISLAGRTMQCLFTEGHARHHYVLSDPGSKSVFTGDSFGISYRELDTANGEFIFPTTTPVHFDPPEAHKAIDRIMQLNPQQLFLTHFSRVVNLPRRASDMHKRIDDFVAIAEQHASDADRTAAMHKSMFVYLVDELRAHGYTNEDDRLHAILDLDVNLDTMGLEFWLDHRR
jgi:glyoxylase-like metal-dependent hydrolase (beta-lactamase superfamily II)